MKAEIIYSRNKLPLFPKQLLPRQVPLVTHIMQDWPITLGTLGADLYPPVFCLENALHRATKFMAN